MNVVNFRGVTPLPLMTPQGGLTQLGVMHAEEEMLKQPQQKLPMEHLFADGVYVRSMFVPAGSWVTGKAHKTDHICILLDGGLTVTAPDGSLKTIEAPDMWVVPAGEKKLGYFHKDTWFANIHPTDTTDLEVIEQRVTYEPEEYEQLVMARALEELTYEVQEAA